MIDLSFSAVAIDAVLESCRGEIMCKVSITNVFDAVARRGFGVLGSVAFVTLLDLIVASRSLFLPRLARYSKIVSVGPALYSCILIDTGDGLKRVISSGGVKL